MKHPGEMWYLRMPVKELLSDERFLLLSLEQKGLLFHALLAAWHNRTLPSTPSDLARIVGATAEQIESLLPSLERFFRVNHGRLISPMLETERRLVKQISEKNAKAADERWRQEKKRQANTSARIAGAYANAMLSESESYSESDPEIKTKNDGTERRDQSPGDRPGASSAAVCAKALSEPEAEKIAEEVFKTIAPGDPRGEWKANRTPLTNLVLECGKDAVESAAFVVLDKIGQRERFRRGPFAYLTQETRRIAAQPKESRAIRSGPDAKPKPFVFPNDADRIVWAFRAGQDNANGEYSRAMTEFCKHTATLTQAQREEVARRIHDADEGEIARMEYRFTLEHFCKVVADEH